MPVQRNRRRGYLLVAFGAVFSMSAVLLVFQYGQPRIFFAMSRDRLLPQNVSKVHPKFGTPYITTIITCVVVALVAGAARHRGADRRAGDVLLLPQAVLPLVLVVTAGLRGARAAAGAVG